MPWGGLSAKRNPPPLEWVAYGPGNSDIGIASSAGAIRVRLGARRAGSIELRWEEQQSSVAGHRLAGPKIGDDWPVGVIVVRRADKTRSVVRVASAAIARQLRIRTHRSCEGDPVRRVIADILGADDARRRDPV